MQIYMLDTEPRRCARMYPDRSLAAAVRDVAKVLSAAHVMLDGLATARARIGLLLPPSLEEREQASGAWWRWAQKQQRNYKWLHDLLWALTREFYVRHHRTHPYELVAEQLALVPLNLPVGGPNFTFVPQCMPARFTRSDPVQAYRLYLVHAKRDQARWSTTAPPWWSELSHSEGLA